MSKTPAAAGRPLGRMPSCISRINQLKDRLSPSELRIAEYVLSNPYDIVERPVGEIAERLATSKATLVRFSQKLGYDGYAAMRVVLARDLGESQSELYAEIEPDDTDQQIIEKTFNISIGGLRDSLATLDPVQMAKAAGAVRRARSLLAIGVGGSGGMAVIAQHRIGRLGYWVNACTDTHTFPILMRALRPEDVVLAISHSGYTTAVVEAVEQAGASGATTIGVCNDARSPLAQRVDILLLTGVGPTPLESEAGSSRIAQIAVIDALTVLVQAGRGEAPK